MIKILTLRLYQERTFILVCNLSIHLSTNLIEQSYVANLSFAVS